MALPGFVVPSALSLAGILFGSGGERKPLSAEELEQLFGPEAISKDTLALFNLLRNSPAFSAMMNSAAMQGANISNVSRANVARAGASGTPMAAFLRQAGMGIGANLQRRGQSDLFMDALRAAVQNIGGRMNAFAGSRGIQQQTPTFRSMVGGSLLGAGAEGFAGLLSRSKQGAGSLAGTILDNDLTIG